MQGRLTSGRAPASDQQVAAPAGRGRPLTSHDVIVQTIAATTTANGLLVHAELDTTIYPTGVVVPDKQMKALETNGILARHAFHGEWNYTLHPTTDTPDPDDFK